MSHSATDTKPSIQHLRRRAAALDTIMRVFTEEWGDPIECLMEGHGEDPEIHLGQVLHVPDHLEDITFSPWELFLMVDVMREAYDERVLAPAEKVTA